MRIDEQYLIDNKLTLREEINSITVMKGAFSIMSEEENNVYANNLYSNGKLTEFIAYSHVIGGIALNEDMVKHVNSKGESGLRKSRDTRSKLAYKTTSLSKAKRLETAIQASKTRTSNPSTMERANRKRRKAKRKRAALGYDQ